MATTTTGNIITDVIGSEGIKIDFKLGFSTQDVILIAVSIFGAVLVAGVILHLLFPNK